ncbi:hypothetical protein QTP86_029015, partial [Hemibagrus guttatus]
MAVVVNPGLDRSEFSHHVQLDPGLPDWETAVSPDREQHLQHHHTEYWGPSGLCAQPTVVHSADSNHIIKFANDTTMVGLISKKDESAYREEVQQLTAWFRANYLSLNADKTKEMVVDVRRAQSGQFLGVHLEYLTCSLSSLLTKSVLSWSWFEVDPEPVEMRSHRTKHALICTWFNIAMFKGSGRKPENLEEPHRGGMIYSKQIETSKEGNEGLQHNNRTGHPILPNTPISTITTTSSTLITPLPLS